MKTIKILSIFMIFLLISCTCEREKPTEDTTVKDVCGNVYKTVTIGNQIWMAENLRTTHWHRDGFLLDPIPVGSMSSGSGMACYVNDDISTVNQLGLMYGLEVTKQGSICPNGWHIPDTAEWKTMETYLIENGYNWDQSKQGNKIAKSLSASNPGNRHTWMSSTVEGSPGCISDAGESK